MIANLDTVVAEDNASLPAIGSVTPDTRAIIPLIGNPNLAETITGIRDMFGKWGTINARSNQFLHELLGKIYEAVPTTTGAARLTLAAEVKKHPDFSDGLRRYDPYDRRKSVEDLYLTMLLGLTAYRSRKTQWGYALARAAELQVERTMSAFVEWIDGHGGIDGAQPPSPERIDRKAELRAKLSDAVAYFTQCDQIGEVVDSTFPVTRLANGLGVTFYVEKEDEDGKRAWQPIDLQCEDELVLDVYRRLEQADEASRRDIGKEYGDAKKAWHKLLRDGHRAYNKQPNVKKKDFHKWVDEHGEPNLQHKKPDILRDYFVATPLTDEQLALTPPGRY